MSHLAPPSVDELWHPILPPHLTIYEDLGFSFCTPLPLARLPLACHFAHVMLVIPVHEQDHQPAETVHNREVRCPSTAPRTCQNLRMGVTKDGGNENRTVSRAPPDNDACEDL